MKHDSVMAQHTPSPLTIHRAKTPDNVGGFDYAILDANRKVIGETFERVGRDDGYYDERPAEANARLWAAAPDLLTALESAALALEEAAKVLAGSCNLPSLGEIINGHAERARAAIAKTKGLA